MVAVSVDKVVSERGLDNCFRFVSFSGLQICFVTDGIRLRRNSYIESLTYSSPGQITLISPMVSN